MAAFDEPLPVLRRVERAGDGLRTEVDLDPTSADPNSESVLVMDVTTGRRRLAEDELAVPTAGIGEVLEGDDEREPAGGGSLTFRVDYVTERFWALDRMHATLREAIRRELETGADRARRKLPFLRERGSAGADRVEGQPAALSRIETILSAPPAESRGVTGRRPTNRRS